ncbi:MAG: hypothetical protein CVU48_01030 [Candidatus Cloacimonetes bacterium HGW-Cloacimonetes-1]|jgi:flavin reductase (DIM6/NTAB) family NADH-FMN oxidoreductase RutF|nr:MAG: hypothetical protein CVU48_01030 [Candidatus Cloacimonetes bacterium HGW-Cloacimonetes-1]
MILVNDMSDVNSYIRKNSKVALVVTEKPDGGYNLITVEWFTRTSIQPPMFAISIGHTRFSYDCLEANRYFNLVFPSIEQQELLKLCGSQSGRDIDKFAVGNVKHIPGKLNKLPVLTDAIVNMECSIINQIRSGDHTLYVGQVNKLWLDNDKELFFYK